MHEYDALWKCAHSYSRMGQYRPIMFDLNGALNTSFMHPSGVSQCVPRRWLYTATSKRDSKGSKQRLLTYSGSEGILRSVILADPRSPMKTWNGTQTLLSKTNSPRAHEEDSVLPFFLAHEGSSTSPRTIPRRVNRTLSPSFRKPEC